MPRNTVYLEAPDRTQDLLSIKWAFRSAGYAIGSTWHEGQLGKSSEAFKDHWNATAMEQLQFCDSLVVMAGNHNSAMPELAMMAGFAFARGLRVIWIGPAARGLSDFRAIQHFNTAEDFRKQLVPRIASEPLPNSERLAA
jgi:hypothetical protein